MNFIDAYFAKFPNDLLIRRFRQICTAEAISWLFLFVAMTWKRSQPDSDAALIFIIIIGNIHGLFFSLYLLFCLPMKKIFAWDDEDFVFVLGSAFFPFATIWVEKKLARFHRE